MHKTPIIMQTLDA